MTINNNCDSYFDFLTSEEIEEWARLRSARDSSGKVFWKDYSAEISFVLRMQIKYNLPFPITHGSIDRTANVDEYIRTRRRSDKLSVILGSDSNEQ